MKRFWQCAGMTLVSALVSAGFAVQGLFGAGTAADQFARYAGSRSIALLVGTVYALLIRSTQAIVVLGIVMSIVQACDGLTGLLAYDPAKTYGPFLFAVLNGIAVICLQREQRRTV